jgi:hypothetical protein
MIFVDNVDVFLFYEDNVPKQVYLTAETLNKQLKDLLESDKIIYNDIIYLDNIFNTLYENKPKDLLDSIMNSYYELPPTEASEDYQKLFTDFGTIKHWLGENN